MADTPKTSYEKANLPGAASEISLSQAILAPLDALFKAQVHSARSFLNLLLQIGYPHVQLDKNGNPDMEQLQNKSFYTQNFDYIDDEGHRSTIAVPSLALIPVAPLSIDSASFKFNFNVQNTSSHSQIQSSERETTDKEESYARDKRPWYLVDEPQSFKGSVAPTANESSSSAQSQSSVINIEINLSKQPLPAGLDRLLTTLQQSARTIDSGK